MARPASDIPDRILVSAREHFAKSGVDGASLRAIARSAKTSVAMIGYHFESKDGLFRAVVNEVYDPFVEALRAVAEAHRDPLERLQALLRRLSDVTDDERMTLRIVMREATIQSDRIYYVLGRFLTGHGQLVREALQAAKEEGEVRDVPAIASLPSLIAPVVLPQFFKPLMEQVIGPEADVSTLVDTALDIVLYGLVPR